MACSSNILPQQLQNMAAQVLALAGGTAILFAATAPSSKEHRAAWRASSMSRRFPDIAESGNPDTFRRPICDGAIATVQKAPTG